MGNITDLVYEAMHLDEMAYDRNSLIRKVGNFSNTIVEHMFKCFTLKNSTGNLNHWEEEIAERLTELDSDIWGTDKKLKYEDYMRLLSSSFNSSVDGLLNKCKKFRTVVKKEYNVDINYDTNLINSLYETLEEIFEKSCKILSTKGSRNREVFLTIVKDAIDKRI